jgi:hypothetical protein
MAINDWEIFTDSKQPEIYFEITKKGIRPEEPISCYFEIDGNSAIEKHCKVYILARETDDSRPFLYAIPKSEIGEWNVFSESGSILPEPYFMGLVPDLPSDYYRSYFDLPPLPEGNWKIEVILEVEQTVLVTSSESQVSVQEEKLIFVKPAPPSWPDFFPPTTDKDKPEWPSDMLPDVPDEPKPEPKPEPTPEPEEPEDKTPRPWTNKPVLTIMEAHLPKDWYVINFGPWEYRIFKLTGKMGPKKSIQIQTAPQSDQPGNVHLLVKRGKKPTISDFEQSLKIGSSDWDFRSKSYIPKKPRPDLYFKYTNGHSAELVECYNDKEVEVTLYAMLYNYGGKPVDSQRFYLADDGK